MRILPLALIAVALPVMASAAEICVRNQTEDRLLFLAEGAERLLVFLEPGADLCAPEAVEGNSRIGVFADEDAPGPQGVA